LSAARNRKAATARGQQTVRQQANHLQNSVQYLVEISVELLDATAAGLVVADGAGRLNVLASTSAQVELLESLQISLPVPSGDASTA